MPNRNTATVLVVDDNPVARDLLRLRMERRNWSVTEAQDAREGLKAFQASKPDLVTLDLVMPINDGIGPVDLARAIHEEAPNTVIVVVSSHASARGIKSFFEKRDIPVLSKASLHHPKMERLLSSLDSLFAGRSTASEIGKQGD